MGFVTGSPREPYFIHIADLIPEQVEDFVLPVFLGDASNVPPRVTVGGVECLQYKLVTPAGAIDVTMPRSLVEDTPKFVRTMLDFEGAVQSRRETRAISAVLSSFEESEREPLRKHIEALAKQFVDLEAKGQNGIWARIATNFLITAAIGRFDRVVGNPPWVDWKNLPEGYREKIKDLAVDRGLFSGDGRTGGINLNVCALIAHVSVTNWLKEDGLLAFLMPKELSVQQSYQGWRRLQGSPARDFRLFVDWTDAGFPFDPVKEDFMTYVIGPKGTENNVPVIKYSMKPKDRTKPRLWQNVQEALDHLDREERVAGQVVSGSTAFTFAKDSSELASFALIAGDCGYVGREGIEFYPQELLLFRLEQRVPVRGKVSLRNIQVTGSKYRVPRDRFQFEPKYLYPLVKGANIKPFYHDYDGIIVPFPYSPEEPNRPVSRDTLYDESPSLLKYYLNYENIIRSQTGYSDKIRGPNAGEFYGLARTGPYSFANAYVCFRDNTNWCAAVVSQTKMPWGETKRFVFQNHAVSMCERNSGGFITEDEAHYICAILNTPIVKRFIHLSSDERSFKIRPPVYVPIFDPTNTKHARLSELSRLAHADPDNASKLLPEMESIYLELCKTKVAVPKYERGRRRRNQNASLPMLDLLE